MEGMMNKTIVTFKALRKGKVIHKNIPIYHDFQELPAMESNGAQLPPTSVEYQVMQHLYGIDKRDIMRKYGFDMILDYYPKKKIIKKNEIEEFINFCKPYLDLYPELIRPFDAVIYESQTILFGKRKSNEQKFKEVLNLVKVAFKVASGTLDCLDKILRESNEELNYQENQFKRLNAREDESIKFI